MSEANVLMDTFVQLLPLLLLVVLAVFFIRRGSGTRSDPDSNRSDIGGGPGDGGGAD